MNWAGRRATLLVVYLTGGRAAGCGAGRRGALFDYRAGTVARLGCWVGVRRGGLRAVVAQAHRGASLIQGGRRPVVNEVQLLAEVVEGEAHHVEEVSMDVLHQHATQSLNTIAASFVPNTHIKG